MLFIDTWGWIALRRSKAPEFARVCKAFRESYEREGICTTNFVLAETITFVYATYKEYWGERILDDTLSVLALPRSRVEEITLDRFERTIEFRRRYRDKPEISFTDLTSMVVMRELGITDILTADRHFEHVNLGFRLVPEGLKRPQKPHRRGRRGR